MQKKKTKRKCTYNIRLIKATWPYTVPEVATLFNVHKGAVLRWLKEGLCANKDQRPYLIRGTEIIRFLLDRQKKRNKCALNEFFCFKCRTPRGAYMDIVDVVIVSINRLLLKGICTVCSTPVHKAQGIRNLQRIRECFHVQQIEGQHIIERIDLIVNSDLEEQT